MLSYTVKFHVDNESKSSQIFFYDLLQKSANRGKMHEESKCWLCGNQLTGYISNYSLKNDKYYIYFKCNSCGNNAEINVPKCSVKYTKNPEFNQNVPVAEQTNNAIKRQQIFSKIVEKPMVTKSSTANQHQTKKSNPGIHHNVTNSQSPKKRTYNNKKNKFISYKNSILFHEPILGDPNSGAIHSSCCSNKCKKCRSRLTGRATRLDENRVALFWKCEKCNDKHDIIVTNNELD